MYPGLRRPQANPNPSNHTPNAQLTPTGGLPRVFLPKGTDFCTITNTRPGRIQRMLNYRPRKCLNYRTPLEVLDALHGVALQN